MNRPLFSIVTPSFNQASFLEQTIRSVLDQPGRGVDFDLEYFVMDGGSQDGSVEIIRQYQDQLAGWVSEPDRGQTHAINKGFARANGVLHAYINSDDFYYPGAFQCIARAYAQSPDADLFHGVCSKVDAQGVAFANQTAGITTLEQLVDLKNHWLRPLDNQNFIQPEVFWTAKLAKKLNGFNESLHYCMDFEYWLRAFDENAQVVRLQDKLAAFRVHEAQKTSDRDKSVLELMQVVQPFLDRQGDPRLSTSACRRIQADHALEHMLIQSKMQSQRTKISQLLSLCMAHPTLLGSKHFRKAVRRSAKQWVLGTTQADPKKPASLTAEAASNEVPTNRDDTTQAARKAA